LPHRKQKLGGISKQGDRHLRRLLIVGATAVMRHARAHPDKHPWLTKLLSRMPAKKAAVALANKTARIAWAIPAKGNTYQAPAPAVTA
jgi:transposase